MYEEVEATMQELTGKDLMETMKDAKETAAGLDNWYPAGFKLLPPEAFNIPADMLNMIEEGREWPKQMKVARAVFLPKDDSDELDPLAHRVLLMLSATYRMWGKTRLRRPSPGLQVGA